MERCTAAERTVDAEGERGSFPFPACELKSPHDFSAAALTMPACEFLRSLERQRQHCACQRVLKITRHHPFLL